MITVRIQLVSTATETLRDAQSPELRQNLPKENRSRSTFLEG
jgi:hypothetical protein